MELPPLKNIQMPSMAGASHYSILKKKPASKGKLSIIVESAENFKNDSETLLEAYELKKCVSIEVPVMHEETDKYEIDDEDISDLIDDKFDKEEMEFGSNTTLYGSIGSINWGSIVSAASFENWRSSYKSISALEQNFFEKFNELPNLEDLSSDDSLEEFQWLTALSTKSVTVEVVDRGKFVDPLTGSDLEIGSKEEMVEQPVQERRSKRSILSVDGITYIEEEEEEEEEELPEDDDLLQEFDYEDEEDEIADAEPLEDDALNQFLQMETEEKGIFLGSTIDFELAAKTEEARQFRLSIIDFVDDLIVNAIKASEDLDMKVKLRNSLDKITMMKKLIRILFDTEVESKARSFLNRKIVEHFRRKKKYRPIIEEHPNNLKKDIIQYKEAITNLDKMLGKEFGTINAVNAKIQQLKDELAEREIASANASESFENLFRETFARENFNRLKMSVENHLHKMATLHKEISELRYQLLQRQHTFATLDEKIKRVQRINENLSMTDYEHLQTETQVLGKKIEERNGELARVHHRLNSCLHMMSHMHEKQVMLKNTHGAQADLLRELYAQKQATREYLHHVKMKRFEIRQQIQDASFKGGLLDKPNLMYDYDNTMTYNRELRERVNNLKERQSHLESKIARISREKRFKVK